MYASRSSFGMFNVIFVIVFIAAILFTISGYGNKQVIKSKIIDKERITTAQNGEVQSYYLIFTEAGPLKLEDEIFFGNFNSSDLYGQLRKDSTYTFYTVGYRIGFMSEYPNIIKFEK
jgi:hypothetical protein